MGLRVAVGACVMLFAVSVFRPETAAENESFLFIKHGPRPEQNITSPKGLISTLSQSMTVSCSVLSALIEPLSYRLVRAATVTVLNE